MLRQPDALERHGGDARRSQRRQHDGPLFLHPDRRRDPAALQPHPFRQEGRIRALPRGPGGDGIEQEGVELVAPGQRQRPRPVHWRPFDGMVFDHGPQHAPQIRRLP